MKPVKVAIISAHYMPEVGYQEVHLARAFARIGCNVKVFTSTASVNLGGKIGTQKYSEGSSYDPRYNFEITRLKALSYKSKAYSTQLRKSVSAFSPELIVILGVAKGFPLPLLNTHFYNSAKIVSLYGDAKEYLERNTFKQKLSASVYTAGYKLLKEPFYRKAVKYCHKIILNIPESDDYFKSFVGSKLLPVYEQKKTLLTLGYDPDEYSFDETTRSIKRKELGLKEDEIVIITSTRINKRKNLESIIDNIVALNSKGFKVKYILVGFLGDDYERDLKAYIDKTQFKNHFICFPFLTAADIRQLYCAADIGVWLKAAISIQEAMGTGLPVILENKSSVNHLVKHNHNGWYFEKGQLNSVIETSVKQLTANSVNRVQLALENSDKLSYTNIAKKIYQLTFGNEL